MKYAMLLAALCATTAQAESLCGVTDPQVVLAALEGQWTTRGATSVESVIRSVVEDTTGAFVIGPLGGFAEMTVADGAILPDLAVDADSPKLEAGGAVYDVDGVDDILDTLEAAWIADAVSHTPCGPEGLLQFSKSYDLDGQVTGTLVVLPYFTDQMVILSQAEVRGD